MKRDLPSAELKLQAVEREVRDLRALVDTLMASKLSERRAKIEKEVALWGLTIRDYSLKQQVEIGYHERHFCRPKVRVAGQPQGLAAVVKRRWKRAK
jgi:hypothetical protein